MGSALLAAASLMLLSQLCCRAAEVAQIEGTRLAIGWLETLHWAR
jgi:hypothetical protein